MSRPVEVINLVKVYGKIRAVDGVSFEVNEKEIFALIGPNGAGKSTILRILATVLAPTDGRALVYGYDVAKEQSAVRQLSSYLPEEAGAYKSLSGLAYLRFMAELYATDRHKQAEAVAYAQEIAGLGSRIKDRVKNYSKGMTRKLLLARAVMMRPQLAILDEPTSGLDVINAMEIRETIRGLSRRGMAVLLSSHNMLEIEFLSDRVGVIHQGKMYDIGTAGELKKRHNAQNLEEVFSAVVKR